MLLQVLVVSLCIITAFAENWASPFRASNFFIGLMKDNTLIGWGYPIVSSHTSTFEAMPSVVNDVQFVYSTNQAVAAVKSDGSVVCFGAKFDGGICAANLNNVIYIAATANSFAAMKQDGTVIAWGGNSANAGSYNPIPSLSQLSGVGNIYSNYYCMFALKGDGSMLGWGEDDCVNVPASGVKNVEEVYTNKLSTFVIKSDDSYQGWGLSVASGSTPPTTGLSMANYIQVESNTGSFCVIQASTDVVCWGSNYISESVNTPLIVPTGLTKVRKLFSNSQAWAALMTDSTVTAFGNSLTGGSGVPSTLTGVTYIVSTNTAFCALTSSNTVSCWGDSSNGGASPTGLKNVYSIAANSASVVALRVDGTIACWGASGTGGFCPIINNSAKVIALYTNPLAFSAVDEYGFVTAWGEANSGGQGPSDRGNGRVSTVWGSTVHRGYSDPRTYMCPQNNYGFMHEHCTACTSGFYSAPESTVSNDCVPNANSPTLLPTAVPTIQGQTQPPNSNPTMAPSKPPHPSQTPQPTYPITLSPTKFVCNPGMYINPGGSCIMCPTGKFSPYTDITVCNNCIAGKSSDAIGSTGGTCTACPVGTYSSEGSAQCTACPAGSWAATLSNVCYTCAAGMYSTLGTSCQICPAGTFSNGGATQCTACPVGQFSSPGSNSCDSCTN
jgi:hypothetical protein